MQPLLNELMQIERMLKKVQEPKNVVAKEIIPETNKVVEEQFIKKVEVKKKEPFKFSRQQL